MSSTPKIIICGAGIAGIATAYHLAVRQNLANVTIVTAHPPLTLTSDKSTEAYRNWWPGPDDAMIRLMNRSIDLLEELADQTDNRFLLNRRGYLYATADTEHAAELRATAERTASLGAGPLRVHTGAADDPPFTPSPVAGFTHVPDGADLFVGEDIIQQQFPYLAPDTLAALHPRRCGWFSGQQLGMYLLETAQAHGVQLTEDQITGIFVRGDRVTGVQLASGDTLLCDMFVNAAGPMLKDVGHLLNVEIPVFSELHIKASFNDHLGVIPRDAPLLIWDDPQTLNWSQEERNILLDDPATRFFVDELPAGVHCRPEGHGDSESVLILWPYHSEPVDEVFPIPDDPLFPEVALRGMARMIPGLRQYIDQLPRPYVDGGYYTKTRENRPLAGPLPVKGAYVVGALSGFGLMASLGVGELVALQIAGADLPDYAAAFMVSRYDDPAYRARLDAWGPSAQL